MPNFTAEVHKVWDAFMRSDFRSPAEYFDSNITTNSAKEWRKLKQQLTSGIIDHKGDVPTALSRVAVDNEGPAITAFTEHWNKVVRDHSQAASELEKAARAILAFQGILTAFQDTWLAQLRVLQALIDDARGFQSGKSRQPAEDGLIRTQLDRQTKIMDNFLRRQQRLAGDRTNDLAKVFPQVRKTLDRIARDAHADVRKLGHRDDYTKDPHWMDHNG